ncbi:hypothetical protein V6Z12_D13G152700 [Gossypium hirsutum]
MTLFLRFFNIHFVFGVGSIYHFSSGENRELGGVPPAI